MAQTPVIPDLALINESTAWQMFNVSAKLHTVEGKPQVRMVAKGDSANRIVGLALPKGIDFATGDIEVDLKGTNEAQRSFLGVAFNVQDERTFEAIYFRPFNFKRGLPWEKRSVQYLAWPEFTWNKLREERPGQFENAVNPVPDPNGWFQVRVEVREKQVRVFVDGAKEPCLVVSRLAKTYGKHPVGLWVDVADGQYAHFKVTPLAPEASGR